MLIELSSRYIMFLFKNRMRRFSFFLMKRMMKIVWKPSSVLIIAVLTLVFILPALYEVLQKRNRSMYDDSQSSFQELQAPDFKAALRAQMAQVPENERQFKCHKTSDPQRYHICVHMPRNDRFVSAAVMMFGYWEEDVLSAVELFLQQSPDSGLVDIGANIGTYAIPIAAKGYPVLAVEPSPVHLVRLVHGIKKSGLSDLVTVAPFAVSNSADRKIILYSPHSGDLADTRVTFRHVISEHFHATSVTLDQLTDHASLRQVVLKMDIGGHECFALDARSSARFFKTISVKVIFMDFAPQLVSDENCVDSMIRYLETDLEFLPFSAKTLERVNAKELVKDQQETIALIWIKKGWEHVVAGYQMLTEGQDYPQDKNVSTDFKRQNQNAKVTDAVSYSENEGDDNYMKM